VGPASALARQSAARRAVQGGLAEFVEARFADARGANLHAAMADLLLLVHALSMDEAGARCSGSARVWQYPLPWPAAAASSAARAMSGRSAHGNVFDRAHCTAPGGGRSQACIAARGAQLGRERDAVRSAARAIAHREPEGCKAPRHTAALPSPGRSAPPSAPVAPGRAGAAPRGARAGHHGVRAARGVRGRRRRRHRPAPGPAQRGRLRARPGRARHLPLSASARMEAQARAPPALGRERAHDRGARGTPRA